MTNSHVRRARCLHNRDGVALPVAIFSLIVLSVLITGVLLSATTESALSFAHRDATQDLYAAEGAIQAYVGQQNAHITVGTHPNFPVPGGHVPVSITVERLGYRDPDEGGADSNTYFAIHASPSRGGRSVSAFVRVVQSPLPEFAGNFDAALTLGDYAEVTGTQHTGYKISDGSDTPPTVCNEAPATSAIVYAKGVREPQIKGNAEVNGAKTESPNGRDEMIRQVLGNISLRDLAWNADEDKRFGRYFNSTVTWTGQDVYSGNRNRRYDWGCPRDMIAAIAAVAPGNSGPKQCAAGSDPNYYPVVAIDGQNSDVEISNSHGQGILIVINGNLKISGKFIYKGLILVERNIHLSGGGNNWPPSIEGAILAGGQTIVDDEVVQDIGDSTSSGNRAIRFNRCAIKAVQNAFNSGGNNWGEPKVNGRPYNWFEIVR